MTLSPLVVWTHSSLTTGMDRELLFFTLMNKIASMRKEVMIKYACDLKGQFSHKWKQHMTYGTTFMVIFHPFLKLDRSSFHWLSLYGNKKQPGYSSEIEQKIESHMGLESKVQSTVNSRSWQVKWKIFKKSTLKHKWQATNVLFIFKVISFGFEKCIFFQFQASNSSKYHVV